MTITWIGSHLKSIWLCALAIVIGFAVASNMDDQDDLWDAFTAADINKTPESPRNVEIECIEHQR